MQNIIEEVASELRRVRNSESASRRQRDSYDEMASKFGAAAEGVEGIQEYIISASALAEEAGNWDLAEYLEALARKVEQFNEELQNCRSACKNIADD